MLYVYITILNFCLWRHIFLYKQVLISNQIQFWIKYARYCYLQWCPFHNQFQARNARLLPYWENGLFVFGATFFTTDDFWFQIEYPFKSNIPITIIYSDIPSITSSKQVTHGYCHTEKMDFRFLIEYPFNSNIPITVIYSHVRPIPSAKHLTHGYCDEEKWFAFPFTDGHIRYQFLFDHTANIISYWTKAEWIWQIPFHTTWECGMNFSSQVFSCSWSLSAITYLSCTLDMKF